MRQERAELTRDALMLAAAESFDRCGYERTTLLDVSRAACVSRGALSFHFGSKEDLAAAVRREAHARTVKAAEALREKNQSALQTLVDLTHLMAHQLSYDPLARAAVQLARELRTPAAPGTSPVTCWRQALTDVAREAEKDGTLTGDASAEAVAELAWRLAFGGHAERTPRETVRQRLTELWELLLPGLTTTYRQVDSAGTEMDQLLRPEESALAS